MCMNAFINVVETRGFSSAGRKLGISKTLISKYVAQLEDVLGVLLLQRTTRRVSTTEVGYAYYQRCIPLLEEVDVTRTYDAAEFSTVDREEIGDFPLNIK